MARTKNDDMLMEDELAAAFLDEGAAAAPVADPGVSEIEDVEPSIEDDVWESTDEFPGQLALDV